MKVTKHTILLVIFMHILGCSSWQAVDKSDYDRLNNEQPSIRVKLVDGTRYETQNYIFHSDTLFILTSKTLFYKGDKVSIPSEEIVNIKRLEVDQVNVALLTLGTVLLILFLIEAGRGFSGAFPD